MEEKFNGSIDLRFDGMPAIRLESYKPEPNASTWQRLAMATRRRRFSLRDDWEIELKDIDYAEELNGIVRIPAKNKNHQSIVFDGASIPFPWLVSLITIGVLRPLGVMLVGSIVHDFTYQHGVLQVSKDGKEFREVPVPRHISDRLLSDIVGTVNKVSAVGYIAWFAVRIGWIGVRYNKKRFGGKPPLGAYGILFALLLGITYWVNTSNLSSLLTILCGVYMFFYILSLVIYRPKS